MFVTSKDEILEVMARAQKNRSTAATGLNEGSSRSHSVLCCEVSRRDDDVCVNGKLVLVDLAGSEMVRKTHATGQQLEEAKMINKSLSALGGVINALTDDKKSHVPYRDSKLTRMLQDSLGGNAKTALIVNVSPSKANASETLSTLRFGHRAKKIKNSPKINQHRSVKQLTALLAKAEAALDLQATYIATLEKGSDEEHLVNILRADLDDEKALVERQQRELTDLMTSVQDKDSALSETRRLLAEALATCEASRDEKSLLALEQHEVKSENEKLKFQLRDLQLELDHLKKKDESDNHKKNDNSDFPISPLPPPPNHQPLQQREKLLQDLQRERDRNEKLERQLQAGKPPEGQCVAKRFEQLVAVHRQLLRKYSALELNLADAEKKIAFRDERIATLEADRRPDLSKFQSDLAALDARLQDALKKTPPDNNGVRTLRGGHDSQSPSAFARFRW